jgi:hypothetical protein
MRVPETPPLGIRAGFSFCADSRLRFTTGRVFKKTGEPSVRAGRSKIVCPPAECGSFSRHGHLVIVLRKPRQLSAVGGVLCPVRERTTRELLRPTNRANWQSRVQVQRSARPRKKTAQSHLRAWAYLCPLLQKPILPPNGIAVGSIRDSGTAKIAHRDRMTKMMRS